MLRKTLAEREDQITNLRIEVHKSTTRIIDFKVFEDSYFVLYSAQIYEIILT